MSNDNVKTYVMYTDGGCHHKLFKPDIGAWAVIIKDEKEISGLLQKTTPDRAEIIAVIKGLREISKENNTKDIIVEVFTDSIKIVNMFKGKAYFKFQMANWKKKTVKQFTMQMYGEI